MRLAVACFRFAGERKSCDGTRERPGWLVSEAHVSPMGLSPTGPMLTFERLNVALPDQANSSRHPKSNSDLVDGMHVLKVLLKSFVTIPCFASLIDLYLLDN